MKLINSATISVFVKPSEEKIEDTRKAFLELIPFSLEEEKTALTEQKATGFNEQQITILSITLAKESYTNAFLKNFLSLLNDEQKELLLRQKESRLDDELNFFIRLDKEKWLSSRRAFITDSGRCFHIKLNIAAYPARRETALAVLDKIFKPESAPQAYGVIH
jgi:RNA binding exosome subunit